MPTLYYSTCLFILHGLSSGKRAYFIEFWYQIRDFIHYALNFVDILQLQKNEKYPNDTNP